MYPEPERLQPLIDEVLSELDYLVIVWGNAMSEGVFPDLSEFARELYAAEPSFTRWIDALYATAQANGYGPDDMEEVASEVVGRLRVKYPDVVRIPNILTLIIQEALKARAEG